MLSMINRLWDYNYSSAHHVYKVTKGNVVLGILENWEGQAKWKAFSGSGFSCKYLSEYYSREDAVAAIIWAAIP